MGRYDPSLFLVRKNGDRKSGPAFPIPLKTPNFPPLTLTFEQDPWVMMGVLTLPVPKRLTGGKLFCTPLILSSTPTLNRANKCPMMGKGS